MAIRYPIEIATFRATGTVTTVTLDNLSQDYDELLVKVSVRGAGAVTNNDCFVSFSNQSGTDHTQPTRLLGNGSAASREAFASGGAGVRICQMPGASSQASAFASANIRVPNYKSTGVKPFYTEGGYSATGQTAYTDVSNAFYASSSPITSVRFDAGSGTGFAVNSTFTVYGIYNVQAEISPKGTGGEVYLDSSYVYHVFKTSSTFVPSQSITADILVVAGGGGGGGTGGRGGGGGAGGLLAHASQSLTGSTSYSVIVGAGGVNGISNARNATNGNNSQFASLTASVGGGYGGHTGTSTNSVGGAGGSGGGAAAEVSIISGGTSTSGQGNNGGSSGSGYGAGGGGGAGAVGGAGSGNNAGVGGNGSSTYSSWGEATRTGQNSAGTYYFAGGGSGGFTGTSAVAGLGGGGLGGSGNGTAGTANTGGGGGGANNGGPGGSGIVIVRYAR